MKSKNFRPNNNTIALSKPLAGALTASPLACALRLTPEWRIEWAEKIKVFVAGQGTTELEFDSVASVGGALGLFKGQVMFKLTDGRSLILKWAYKQSFKSQFENLIHLVDASLERRANERLLTIAKVLGHWKFEFCAHLQQILNKKGWIATSDITLLEQKKYSLINAYPELSIETFDQWVKTQGTNKIRANFPSQSVDLIDAWREPISLSAKRENLIFFKKTQESQRSFFETFELNPLTQEQVKAVIQQEDRMLLVASAGSGKTSTLTAKITYLIKQGFYKPQEILALSFNKIASEELGERLKQKAKKMAINCDDVHIRTFHGLGLSLIGEITGQKPRVAPWVANVQDIDKISELATRFKAKSDDFSYKWELFKAVFLKEVPSSSEDFTNPEVYDRATRMRGFRTNRGELVKSHSERILADWLHFNGIEYLYERKYEIPTATSTHGQYHPDFYLPDFDVYLELWALNSEGNPPPDFSGYALSMEWKRELHMKHGTKLLEVTSHEVRTGKAFDRLSEYFLPDGNILKNYSSVEVQPHKNGADCPVSKLCRKLISLMKINEISMPELKSRISKINDGFAYRYSLFLELFEPIFEQWQQQLKENNWVDFDDMLLLSNQCLDKPGYVSPYKYILVDEFQDSSQLRLKILDKLAKSSEAKTFVVGDDWQSINKFAGSDPLAIRNLSMSKDGVLVSFLEKTFRCNQAICDVAGNFVKVDKNLLSKKVESDEKTTSVNQAIKLIKVKNTDQIGTAVVSELKRLEQQAIHLNQKLEVFVLGRYNVDKSRYFKALKSNWISVEFSTMHSSKGRQCDHVIIPAMLDGASGFPSLIESDPLLTACLPNKDEIKNSEERRLFYVAMTRAKKSVSLITVSGLESEFIKELLQENKTIQVQVNGNDRTNLVHCPKCKLGELELKFGVNGDFWGCNRFPSCTHTQKALA